MADDFDDFDTELFKGGTNAFDSFDDDVFKNSTVAAEFDEFSNSPKVPIEKNVRSSSFKNDEQVKKKAPPPPKQNNNLLEQDDEDFAPPPPGTPPVDDDDDDFAPPPPVPPPKMTSSRKQSFEADGSNEDNDYAPPPPPSKAPSSPPGPPPKSSKPPPPPPMPPPPPPSQYEEEEDDNGYDRPQTPQSEYYEDEDHPPPPGSPPVNEEEEEEEVSGRLVQPPQPPHEEFDDDDDDAQPPPQPPPEEDEQYSTEEEEEEETDFVLPPEAPPPTEYAPPPPRKGPIPPPVEEYEEEIEESEEEPPPPPPVTMEDEDQVSYEEDNATPPPPPPPKVQPPIAPPPVPKRDENRGVAYDLAKQAANSISQRDLNRKSSVEEMKNNETISSVQDSKQTPPVLVSKSSSSAMISEEKRENPITLSKKASEDVPSIVLPPPPADNVTTSTREREREVIVDEEEEAKDRRDSIESLSKIMKPPSHPPPQIQKMSAQEEKTVMIRFLRIVDSQTRTLNGFMIREVRDVYKASDLDFDGKVKLKELSAAFKMLDPELSLEQTEKFVQSIFFAGGLSLGRDYFANPEEFELGVSKISGIDVSPRTVEAEEFQEEKERAEDALIVSSPTRRLDQYALWIDSFEIWPPILDLVEALKSGVLLCRLVEHLVRSKDDPKFKLRGVNAKPRTKAPCVQNLEIALSIVWKQKVIARNMPTAERLYNGDSVAVLSLMKEMFVAFSLPLQQREMFEWFDDVVRHYGRELPESLIHSPHRGAWAAFGGGDVLACVLHFFCGPEGIERLPAVDLSRFYLNPVKVREVRHNATELFDLFEKSGIPVPWTVEDFVQAVDQDMLLVQLSNIFLKLKQKTCALPLIVPGGVVPIHAKQYVLVSTDGNVEVVGIHFREVKKEETPIENNKPTLVLQDQSTRGPSSIVPVRTFSGFHSFSSEDDRIVQEELSAEIFYLQNPSVMSVPPPPVLSQVMAKSSTISLQKALARTNQGEELQLTISNPDGVIDPVSEIKSRLKHRLRKNSVVEDSKYLEERRLFHLEDLRRKTFLKNTEIIDDREEQLSSAISWLKTPREVYFHNRNSVDKCKLFMNKKGNKYDLEWFDLQTKEKALVSLFDIAEMETKEDGGKTFLFLHLRNLRTSKGRAILKIEPIKPGDGLRMYANLSILVEDIKKNQKVQVVDEF